ncbi:MAG: hypothetical protein L0H84_23740, partial [Pseudonocardia sp.]|nr:hypothetical protein [Pseudonocardia sp.]
MRPLRAVRRLGVMTAGAVLASALIGLPHATAHAAASTGPAAVDDTPQSWTFGCTGAAQSFTVPDGVSFLGVDAHGGHGGSRAVDEGGMGGPAGRVTATIPVTPQQVLSISVGCAAQSRAPG